MAKKVVFIRIWPSPPIAASVERLLVESFPEYKVETIDIIRLLKARRDILLRNVISTFRSYGPHCLLRKDRFKIVFFGTPYLFQAVKALLATWHRQRLSHQQDEIAFTFQLQSLFDASQPGIPHFVYTDHTMLENLRYPAFDRRKLYTPEWIDLERSIYTHATMVFTRSSNISTSLIDEYRCPPEKVVCVYAGSNAQVKESGLENAANSFANYQNGNILFVGTNWELKGGPVLLEAFQKVLLTHPQARLTIVGCSPNIGALPAEVRQQIEVAGLIPVKEVHRYYQRASVFCLPTLVEAFGVVFVEALSYRLPVVATAVGATSDFVQEGVNGYLVKPSDASGLAQALISLVGNPEKCRAFGEKSYQLARDRYNWGSVGEAIRREVFSALEPARFSEGALLSKS